MDNKVSIDRSVLENIYDMVCSACTGYETGEEDKASDLYYKLVEIYESMVNAGVDEL